MPSISYMSESRPLRVRRKKPPARAKRAPREMPHKAVIRTTRLPKPATRAGCPIQAVLWLEWDSRTSTAGLYRVQLMFSRGANDGHGQRSPLREYLECGETRPGLSRYLTNLSRH